MLYTYEEISQRESIDSLKARNSNLAQTGIYRIVSPSGKSYVGLTTRCFRNRWRNHVRDLRSGNHICTHLQSSVNKHGLSNFSFEILEVIADDSIFLKEQQYWDHLNSEGTILFNGRPAGDGKGVHPTPETNRKRSETFKRNRAERMEQRIASCPEILSKENLTRLYFRERLPVNQIAELAGLKSNDVTQVMDYLGLDRRSGAATRVGLAHKQRECDLCKKMISTTMFERHVRKCERMPSCQECSTMLTNPAAKRCWTCISGEKKTADFVRSDEHRAAMSKAAKRRRPRVTEGANFITIDSYEVNGIVLNRSTSKPQWVSEDGSQRFHSLKEAVTTLIG